MIRKDVLTRTYLGLRTILLLMFVFLALGLKEASFVSTSQEKAYEYLRQVFHQYHHVFYVYRDADAGGNHFTPSGWMGDLDDISFDSACIDKPHSGYSCVKIEYSAKRTRGNGWAGIYWLYPDSNWGDFRGYNLTGAKHISFWARGQKGGEKAEFKAGGINRPPHRGSKKPFQDSFGPLSTGVITLSKDWKRYTISLKGRDLKNVIGGFCWVTNIPQNRMGCTIYLDDIQLNLSRGNAIRFLNSYNVSNYPQDRYLANVAFTYDNALVLLALLARGSEVDLRQARILANGFLYAQEKDR